MWALRATLKVRIEEMIKTKINLVKAEGQSHWFSYIIIVKFVE